MTTMATLRIVLLVAPLSEFDQQIIQDHHESSVAECKLVTNMLLKCAEFAKRLGDRTSLAVSDRGPRASCLQMLILGVLAVYRAN